jgi:hypothetical protein
MLDRFFYVAIFLRAIKLILDFFPLAIQFFFKYWRISGYVYTEENMLDWFSMSRFFWVQLKFQFKMFSLAIQFL